VTEEVFARKLLLAGRQLHPKEIQNEIRAVLKVCCGETPHPNIVKVLRHGTLPITRHVYLDLELCEFNLEWYIKKRLWKPTGEELSETGSSRLPQLELLTRARYIWVIMMQVASGLEFIHGLKEVHRDLKPRNGRTGNIALIVGSSLFLPRAPLESGGFRLFCRRDNFHGPYIRVE
jgi:serine/threonine protein kinase